MAAPFGYVGSNILDPGRLSADFSAGVGAVAGMSASDKARLATSFIVGAATTRGLGMLGDAARAGEAADEVAAASRAADRLGASGLSRAGDFGIWPYRTLRSDPKGMGLEAHHLIEGRFARIMGQDVGDMASIAVTHAEHQSFTNAWRTKIPYGPGGTGAATPASVTAAARQVYVGRPDILRALGLVP